jgi:hypothetical protein
LILERKRASCTGPGCSGSRGSSVGLGRTGRQAIFIYGCALLGISYLLAFFRDHLLKKRSLRLKRRFARRAPIAKPLQADLEQGGFAPSRARSQRPHPRPDLYFRRRRAAIRAAQAPAANNASVAGSGTGCEPPPLPPGGGGGGGPGGGGQRDGMMQTTCAFAGGTDEARRLPTTIMARLSFRIRSPRTKAQKPSLKIMQSSC